MKCENENCENQVLEADIERGCAGVVDHDDCTRYCSCCTACRQECINSYMEDDI